MNKTGKFAKKNIQEKELSILKSISNEIQENLGVTYMDAKYNPGLMFQGKIVNKKKTRKIKQEHFPKLLQVEQLINIYENLHNDIRVTEVWFLTKKGKGNGFENFHYNYKNIKGESHDVSFTVVVNLGKFNEANDIVTMYTSLSNEEPSILTGSRRKEMMRKLCKKEKKRSIYY
jgi:hypothetical protein